MVHISASETAGQRWKIHSAPATSKHCRPALPLPFADKIATDIAQGPAVIGEPPGRRPEKARLSTRTGLKHALKPGWTVARSIFSVNQLTPAAQLFVTALLNESH